MSRAAAEIHDALAILATFGETCTYIPANGEARDVSAEVQESTDRVDEIGGVFLVRRLFVFVRRDAVAGIDAPQLGDGFCREDDHDEDGTPLQDKIYSFSGGEHDVGQVAWTLQFIRKTPLIRGGNRMQR